MVLHRQLRDELGSEEGGAQLLRVGAVESALHTWLIPLLEHLRREHPRLELELTVEITPVLLEQVKRGNLDLVFAAAAQSSPGIRTRALPPMEMVFVGPLAMKRREPYALEALARHELMTFQRGSPPHVALLELLRSAGVEPPRLHTVSSIPAMVRLVEGGFGIATLPRVAAQSLVKRHQIALLACDTELPVLALHASYRLDPGSSALPVVVRGALQFIDQFGARKPRAVHKKNR
jgi:DNA-binding transcriptional LysR family regulator